MPQPPETHFLLTWPVLAGYQAASGRLLGLLEPNEATKKASGYIYDAAKEPWMALEFARVNWPTREQNSDHGSEPAEERIKSFVAFCAKYGALRKPTESIQSPPDTVDLCSIEWALVHAAALDTILTLNGALATAQLEIVDCQLDAMAACDRIGGSVSGPAGQDLAKLDLDLPPRENRKERVDLITAMLLNPNLGGIRMVKGGQQHVAFQALYELLHSQVAVWCARATFGQCDGCGGFFPRSDGRQKYCPALLGQKESRCAMRDRSRRRRGSKAAPLRRRPMELLLRQSASTDREFTYEMASAPADVAN